jgi:hypothetical protein
MWAAEVGLVVAILLLLFWVLPWGVIKLLGVALVVVWVLMLVGFFSLWAYNCHHEKWRKELDNH